MISMSKIKTSMRQFNYRVRHDYFAVENLVLGLAIVLCMVWTYQSIVAMTKNWELSESLAKKKRELELVTLEVEAAELENEYYQTEEYQEILARKYLDKELPGENMVVLPENSEVAKSKYKTAITEETETSYSNFEKWKIFLFPSQ